MIKIGITSIDEDHEKIIKVLDHCLSILVDDSLDNFEKANFVTLSLGEIGRHITQHFAEEEKYMTGTYRFADPSQ